MLDLLQCRRESGCRQYPRASSARAGRGVWITRFRGVGDGVRQSMQMQQMRRVEAERGHGDARYRQYA